MEYDSFYLSPVLEQAPRLLGLLDRESQSPSYGSLDREHWSWKFRDYPIGMLQAAVFPLALLWAKPFGDNPFFRNPRLFSWILAGFRHTLARQHANGSFDGYSPNDQDPGVTLGVVHGLMEAYRQVRAEFPKDLERSLLEAVRRACDFAFTRPESHAFISNHWALFAMAFLEAAELLGDQRYRSRSNAVVARILAEQSPDGWYNEYGGPDPGYETLGIFHLAKYWQRTGDSALLESLKRSVEFLAHCVHPDGSTGGVYGSRHTSLYSPAGLEILAGEIPLAASISNFMRTRLARGNAVTLATVDAHNLVPLMISYLEAALVPRGKSQSPPLPCEQREGIHHFAGCGITTVATPAYYAVVNARKGGVCRVFDRSRETLAYEDAGYVAQSGQKVWISQTLGLGQVIGSEGARLELTASFTLYQPTLPTPFNYLVLRLLGLTLFRSPALGAWIRARIVSRLITRVRRAPLHLRRLFVFKPDAITCTDELELERPVHVHSCSQARALTGIHMGSAKYFHPSELAETPQAPVAHMAGDLTRAGRAVCNFSIQFSSVGGALLMAGETNPAGGILEKTGIER